MISRELNNQSYVLLVRHANSLFNLKYVTLQEKHGYDVQIRDLFCDDEFRDSPLSPFGIEQCIHASQYANQIDIDMVVSKIF
jgi:broad specificity phosphatase PhoE